MMTVALEPQQVDAEMVDSPVSNVAEKDERKAETSQDQPTGEVGGIGHLSPPPPLPRTSTENTEEKPDPLSLTNLFHFARTGDFPELITLLGSHEHGWPTAIDARDQDKHTLLHWAALFNATDFISRACTRCSKDVSSFVNAKSANGQTAFMWACLKGHLECMRLLYHEFGADISAFDSLRADGGILAVQHHQHNAMLLLWRWRKKMNGQGGRHPFDLSDHMGCTAVHWAAYKGDILALRILNYMGADMNATDNSGMTPLHRATGEGWNDCALFLVSICSSDANLKNSKNESSIDIARRLENKGLLISLALAMDKQQRSSSTKTSTTTWLEDSFGNDPDIQFKWALPAIFVVCISCVAISFLSDFSVSEIPRTNWASIVFTICVTGSILLFSFLVTGDPGVVPKRPQGKSALEDLAESLDSGVGSKRTASSSALPSQDISRICFTCWEWKGLRTKHCSVCNVCVDGFDHHCGWLNNCVAEKNHREFILMILFTFIGSLFYLGISISVFLQSETTLWTVWYERPLVIPCWVINGLICPWLGMLVGHQLRTIALNLNTNEMMNMHRYSHFWDGPLTNVVGIVTQQQDHQDAHDCDDSSHHHHHHDHQTGGRKFRNPFDQGSVYKNCKYFWFRSHNKQKQHLYSEIELAEYV